jgi:two-component system, NtrC family, response regulator HydG
MTATLTVVIDGEPEKQYMLDPDLEYRIGRGNTCQIPLADPLSSREHAAVYIENDQWHVRDLESRNGTFLGSQKIDDAQLVNGSVIRIGGTELHFSKLAISVKRDDTSPPTETLMLDIPAINEPFLLDPRRALKDKKRVEELLDLYQLSIQLLRSDDPDKVSELALELLIARTKATVIGLLWLDDNGLLQPLRVLPDQESGKTKLSRKLTDMVIRNQRAVWYKNEQDLKDVSLKSYADVICVPLLHDNKPLGALHLYCDHEQFSEIDVEFTTSAARIVSMALVRARKQALLLTRNQQLVARSADFDELLGDSAPMKILKERIVRVAAASGCVLIRGESGSGKELVARALHRSSPRADRPMLSVNCAAIPAELMESQLFGHKKGAFTGADADHPGWFQQAHTGTLFLDEVGELTLEGQAKLLRILEGHPFLPVGSKQEVRVDVRVIAATNRDLSEFVKQKRFREDLFYRLTVFELTIPPLRDRGTDIGKLVDHFFEHFCRLHGRQRLKLSDETRNVLLKYQWPGNVRQLRNVIDSAVVMANEDQIRPGDLGLREASAEPLETLRLDLWEKKLIQEALLRSGGKVPEAANLLGLSRATLYRKLEEYQIDRP